MKLRDSGMPDEQFWESLFDIGLIVSALGIDSSLRDVAELGCGYGTFTIPIARTVSGRVFTFDIDPALVWHTLERSELAGLSNVVCCQRDVMEEGFGLSGIDAALLFNILHCENPQRLLNHAVDAVHVGGWVFVIHWRVDALTPRGPSLDIRPKPGQIIGWAEQTGRVALRSQTIDLPPWHYGLRFQRAT